MGLIRRMGQAGTLESADCLVTVVRAENDSLDYRGGNRKLFGERTRKLVQETLARFQVSGVQVTIQDQGALELVIRARLETALSGAIERAKQAGELSRDVDAAEAAVFLVCTTQGLNVLAKTRPSRRTLEAITRHAFTALGFEA